MKQFTKAYLMVVMLALSSVGLGLGGSSGIGSVEAQTQGMLPGNDDCDTDAGVGEDAIDPGCSGSMTEIGEDTDGDGLPSHIGGNNVDPDDTDGTNPIDGSASCNPFDGGMLPGDCTVPITPDENTLCDAADGNNESFCDPDGSLNATEPMSAILTSIGEILMEGCGDGDAIVNPLVDVLNMFGGEAEGCLPPAADNQAPTAPTNLVATPTTGAEHESVDLSWDAATDAVGIDHYTVYYSTMAGVSNSTNQGSADGDDSTSLTVAGLDAETKYYFVVSAFDAAGNEGPASNEANATTGTAPPPEPETCPEGAPDCATIPGGAGVLSTVLGTVFDGDGAPFFPDEGGEGDLQIVIPGGPAVLSYQDSDGDGDTDFEELSGCGTGVPINPFNAEANCDNYDGDDIDNDDDPNPFSPDTLLILTSAVTTPYVAPAYGDQIVLEYQCYQEVSDISVNVAKTVLSSGTNNGAFNDANPEPIFSYVSGAKDDRPDGNCHEHGQITFDHAFELNVTNAKGNHASGQFDFTLVGTQASAGTFSSNEAALEVTNAAEDGSWTAVCTLNTTGDNGYCGEPGEWAILNGVNVTYGDDRFPSKHPHPDVPVTYNVTWTFNHTSYLTGEKQNLTQISIERHETDDNCGSGTNNRITFGESSQGCSRNALDRFTFDFTAPNGTDDVGNPFYSLNTTYTVRASGAAGSVGHNQYFTAEAIDRGGTATYWGEKTDSNGNVDDHDKFTLFFKQFNRVNQAPTFSYVHGSEPSHDNTTAPYVVHDREAGTVALRVILDDDRSYGDVGSPGDDLNVTIHYAITDNHSTPDPSAFINVSNLATSSNPCTSPLLPTSSSTCDFQGDGDGANTDGIDDRVDGNTANSEAFEHVVTVPDGKVVHYTFSVSDSESAVGSVESVYEDVPFGTTFTYLVGELPPDPAGRSSLEGRGVDSDVETLIGVIDTAISTALEQVTGEPGNAGDAGDPWDTNENNITDEPNGQIDLVERFVYYIDTDAGPGRDDEYYDTFDGSDEADGVTLHLTPTSNGYTEQDHPVVRVGDVNGTDQFELVVLTDGSDTLCVVEHPGQADVSVFFGGAYDKDAASPCGDEVTSDVSLKAVEISNEGYTGYIIYADADNDDERDGAEKHRSNMDAQSCEDVLIVAIAPEDFIVRLLEVEPYSQDPCVAASNQDTDGDGTPDDEDEFPDDPNEDTDSDGDGIGDNADPDDNDGPKGDKDGDGISNEDDWSDDGNQVPDELEEPGALEICVRGIPVVGTVGICYSDRLEGYYIIVGSSTIGPRLPL